LAILEVKSLVKTIVSKIRLLSAIRRRKYGRKKNDSP